MLAKQMRHTVAVVFKLSKHSLIWGGGLILLVCDLSLNYVQFTLIFELHCRVYNPLKRAGRGCALSDYDELPAAYQHELAYGVRT